MHKPQFLKSIINTIADKYGNNPGKMLVHTGVIGWALSSMAQVFAIVLNDKISKEQKMYMIPQEIADAGVNIVSFYLITQSFKSVALKMVNTGKILPSSVKNFLSNNGVADVGKKSFDVVKHGNLTKELSDVFSDFRNGVDVIATTIGSILSCNIVTPLVRNEIAAHRQKSYIAKMDKSNQYKNDVYLNSDFYVRPSVANFQSTAYSKNINSRGSMTI